MYEILKKALFCLPSEQAHSLALQSLKIAHNLGMSLGNTLPDAPVNHLGLKFNNPLGIAAGLDKNADYLDALMALGVGFVEVGTVTPMPQQGNDQPRLFRLPEHQAIVNRLGFNNKGVQYVATKLQKRCCRGIVGVNIGKGVQTPLEDALQDYKSCMQQLYHLADYTTINISSPNTANLRQLQTEQFLGDLIQGILDCRKSLVKQHGNRPILIKIAPDNTHEQLKLIAETAISCGIDGIIATNTTLDHTIIGDGYSGGCSGKPLFTRSTEVLHALKKIVKDRVVLVGVGGIASADDAKKKLEAGADLLQLYTGFVYQGPKLLETIVKACAQD